MVINDSDDGKTAHGNVSVMVRTSTSQYSNDSDGDGDDSESQYSSVGSDGEAARTT